MSNQDLKDLFERTNSNRTMIESEIIEHLKTELNDFGKKDKEYLRELIELRDRILGCEVQIDQIRSLLA
jgi:hypothetical protein